MRHGCVATPGREGGLYVVHCAMWGKFAGWQRFKRTGGDSRKILRLEVDYTRFYDNKDGYILVPPAFGAGGKIAPSGLVNGSA